MHYVSIYPPLGVPHHTHLHVEPGFIRIRTCVDDVAGGDGDSFSPRLAGRNVRLVGDYTLNLEELWQKNEWKDCCIWAVVLRDFTVPQGVVNILADSFPARRPYDNNGFFINAVSTLKFVVPYAEASFEDMTFFMRLPAEDCILESNVSFSSVSREICKEKMFSAMPDLRIAGPDLLPKDGIGQYTVSAFLRGEPFQHPLDVDVCSINGYAPRSRIRVTGSGTATLRALDLQPGERIKLKVGFRYFAAVAEKTIEVTA